MQRKVAETRQLDMEASVRSDTDGFGRGSYSSVSQHLVAKSTGKPAIHSLLLGAPRYPCFPSSQQKG